MSELLVPFLSWYLVIQLLSLAVLPLCVRLFANLPDRGYVFAKMLGILLVSVTFWLGVAYGLLSSDVGGAWLALLLVTLASALVGRSVLTRLFSTARPPLPWRSMLVAETLFLVAFALWAYVRSHDPAANHTEQPMDLMFMNSIWMSADFPPEDAWLGGYAISYYYLGYWMLTTIGRLAGQPPAIAYNVGQASWFGLLLLGSFGVVFNLLLRTGKRTAQAPSLQAVLGGLLASVAVGLSANVQSILEWLYANGIRLERLNRWIDVYNFEENATVSNQWFINTGWWWWRSSRVIEDLDLNGNHIEVIDEFPIFSYILGDNHPHVLAMPFVLLVIGLALTLFWSTPRGYRTSFLGRLHALLPLGWIGLLLMSVASGALIFLNTWDFPPYWLLLAVSGAIAAWRSTAGQNEGRLGFALGAGAALGGALAAGTLLIYLPYFITAQSQAGGFLPNLFYPTRLPQFLVMFGGLLLALLTLLLLGWQRMRPTLGRLSMTAIVVLMTPLAFLALSAWAALNTPWGAGWLERVALPAGATDHLPFIIERWTSEPFTFILIGLLLTGVLALLWQGLSAMDPHGKTEQEGDQALFFALLLAGIGLALLYAPEFVYLRDNFGTRMNTIFKFYYQGWLLLGLSGAYALAVALKWRGRNWRWWTAAPALPALLLILGGLIFPVAGAYSKTDGFAAERPTFDATDYVSRFRPNEAAAAQWVQEHVPPGTRVLEGKGSSYQADTNRISTMTGRPTLLGWAGHESQWRGQAYGEMAQGRSEALEIIYRTGTPAEIAAALAAWEIDYVYVGPSERTQYGPQADGAERFETVLDLVFEAGDVRIFRRRG